MFDKRKSLCLAIILTGSCVPDQPIVEVVRPPELAIKPKLVKQPEPVPEAPLSEVLERISKSHGQILADAVALQQAREAEIEQPSIKNCDLFIQVMTHQHTTFANQALKDFIRCTDKIGNEVSPVDALWASVSSDLNKPFFKKNSLRKKSDFESYVSRITDRQLSKSSPTPTQNWQQADPFLSKAAKVFCNPGRTTDSQWQAWRQNLTKPYSEWLQVQVEICQNHPVKAIKLAIQWLDTHSKKAPAILTLQVLKKKTRLKRHNDKRKEAADSYEELLEHWDNHKGEIHAQNKSRTASKIDHINDVIWGARYQAIANDYSKALEWLDDAQSLIEKLRRVPRLSSNYRRQINELQIEVHHVRALRVLVERGEWQQAAIENQKALATTPISTSWSERLKWFTGLYFWQAGVPEKAESYWAELLSSTRQDSTKAKVHYWLARTYDRLNRPAAATEMRSTLSLRWPMNFYSVVGLNQFPPLLPTVGTDVELAWRNFTEDKDHQDLILRAEAISKANAQIYARPILRELRRKMRQSKPPKTNPDVWTKLSRLYHDAGLFNDTISITTWLANNTENYWVHHPDQVRFYYPTPFLDIYRFSAAKNQVPPELLLAITRQESGFRPGVTSPAAAFGLMQLIVPTARRLDDHNRTSVELISKLKKPDFNVRLGSLYLKQLLARYPEFSPAAFAAYNAGEFMADLWQQTRPTEDSMVWTELVPFGETKGYVKGVWRNLVVYQNLLQDPPSGKALSLHIPERK